MGENKMANLNDQILKIVDDYRAAGMPWPATKLEIGAWAVANDRYQITRGVAINQVAERIVRAMGLEHVRDKKGRSVRKFYAARIREDGQLTMKWDDWNAPRPFMEVSSANRRNQILGECRQLKNDMDSYSERRCPENPIQTDFNFNVDLEELEQLDDVG
jgi:hypothetical protein